MNHKERMLAGLAYKPWLDGLTEDRMAARRNNYEFNNLPPDEVEKKMALIAKLFGKVGKEAFIEAPFHCDYGYNIEVGDHFYANYNCVMLDIARIRIGNCVMLAPNVSIYTAGHPLHPDSRNSGYEYGRPVTIGDNVWIGGNVVINPGVTIGSNVVIGSGSVVTKDIPDWTLAAGNPCRVLRAITEEDRDFYYRNLRFDVDDYC